MMMSMFSSFEALSAESFGQKVGFSWSPTTRKDGKVADASSSTTPIDKGNAPSSVPLNNESVSKGKVGNSTAEQKKKKAAQVLRRTRFAPELDGVFCFETIVPY